MLPDDSVDDAPASENAVLSPKELYRKLIELVDAIDSALRAATRPLAKSCERVGIGPVDAPPVVTLDRQDRAALQRPLELPMPSRAWRPARVRFVRIHRETGEVTFRFIEPGSDKAVDDRFTAAGYWTSQHCVPPNNPFTTAFNENAPLPVLVQEQIPTPGRLKPKYTIQHDMPDRNGLFQQRTAPAK